MIYAATIEHKNKTDDGTVKHTVLKVTKGLVYKVDFYFPSGPSGLVGVKVFDGAFQVWPSTIGEWFASDNETIRFDDMYLKESAPYQFDIYTYNNDVAYDHTMMVRVGLVSKEVFLARFMPTRGYDYLVELTRRLEAEQAERAAAQKEVVTETPYEWLAKQLEEV